MDEQRLNAYIQLIEQLLTCPNGEEAAILSNHPELVDAELVQVMQAVADKKPGFCVNLTSLAEPQLRNPVSDQNANWLRNFAQFIEAANYSLPTLQKKQKQIACYSKASSNVNIVSFAKPCNLGNNLSTSIAQLKIAVGKVRL